MVKAMSKATRQQLCDANMDEIFRTGLHEFLADFVAKNAALTAQISTDYNLARDR